VQNDLLKYGLIAVGFLECKSDMWPGCSEVGIDAENDIGYMDHSNYSAIGKEILINN